MEDRSAVDAPAAKAKVLVIDDNLLSAKKLAMTIAKLGHDVETAFDGQSALDLVSQRPFDVVFLDILMPEMDGYEVLRRLNADETLRDLPVIVVSALEGDVESVARALQMGAEDFLPKAFDLTLLKARLDSTLQKKRFRDRELDYLRDVSALVSAAQVIEAGSFRPSDLDIGHVATRPDQLGLLAKVLERLTEAVYERERLQELRARTLWGTIMVIVSGGLFASAPALGRLGAEIGLPALDMVILANVVGAVFCLAISFFRAGVPKFRLAHLRFCLIWAMIYGCVYKIWLVIVAENVEATTIALIASSRTFIVFALAAFIALEKPSVRRLLGLGVGLAAVGMVLVSQGAFLGDESTLWIVAALGLPLLLSVHTLLMAWGPKDLDAFSTTALMLAVAAVLTVAAGAVLDLPMGTATMDLRAASIILAFGVATSLAVALALDIVARAGAVFASQIAYIQTLAGIAWGMLLLDERMAPLAWGAAVMVLLGFLLVRPKQAGEEFSISLPLDKPRG